MRIMIRTLLFLSLISSPLVAFAQTARITGYVQDTHEAYVRGAQVSVVELVKGTIRAASTNSSGLWEVPFLNPGPYRVYIQAPGFSTAVSDAINLTVGQTLLFNVKLIVGTRNDQVTVTTGSQMINTTDGTVGTVIDQRLVENMPLNGRSIQDLLSMVPGVVTESPQTGGNVGWNGDFSVNGQRTESNYYMIDGVSGNTNSGSGLGPGSSDGGVLGSTTALGTTQSLVPIDALQEFRVATSSYSAEFGRSPGGQFSLITKSGSNQFHGTLSEYLRNNFFDANDWFNDNAVPVIPIQALRQNDFGGTLGGPVRIPHFYNGANKSFFFAAYEGLRLLQPQASSTVWVPDLALRQAAAEPLRPILNAIPLPTSGGIDNGTMAQYKPSYSLPSQIDTTSVRFDQVITPKTAAFFKFQDSPSYSSIRTLASLRKTQMNSHNYTFGATTQFSSLATNEYRMLYSRGDTTFGGQLDSTGGAQPTNLAAALGAGAYPNTTSDVLFSFSNLGSSTVYQSHGATQKREWNLVDTFLWTRGRNHLRFGVDYVRISDPYIEENPTITVGYFSTQQVINNKASFISIGATTDSEAIYNETSLYVADEWQITPRLNLSMGLRWELDPAPHGANGKDAYTVLGNVADPSTLQLAPRGTPLWATTWFNFAPRFGAAWRLNTIPGHEMVLRGGFGVFFDSDNEYSSLAFSGEGFSGYNYPTDKSIPIAADQLTPSTAAVPPYSSGVYAFPSHLQLPYTLEWNVGVQQAIDSKASITATYAGAAGRRLFELQQLDLSSVTTDFTDVYFYPGNGTSDYSSLQLSFQRSVGHGLDATASYSWSHSIDVGSTASTQAPERGNSDFDLRHNFQAGLTWDVPQFEIPNAFIHQIVNGWGLDGRVMARTSMPVTLYGGTVTTATRIIQGGVNQVPGQPLYLTGTACRDLANSVGMGEVCPGGHAINPAAFSLPDGTDPGNAPRNQTRGFGQSQFNLSARRSFSLPEKVTLQFKADAFNVFNHPTFGTVDNTVTDPEFGLATASLSRSLSTMNALYQQGGARSMQFSLKLLF